MLDREPPGRRIGAGNLRRRSAGCHTAQRGRGVRGGSGTEWKSRPRATSRAHRRNVAQPVTAASPRMVGSSSGTPAAALGCRGLHQAPECESKADRGGAVHPATAHLARDHDHHRAAGDAAVLARGDGHLPDRRFRRGRAPAAHVCGGRGAGSTRHRATRSYAGLALHGASFDDRRRVPLPALDVERALDDTRTASIPRHANRNTTRSCRPRSGLLVVFFLWPPPRRCAVLRAPCYAIAAPDAQSSATMAIRPVARSRARISLTVFD